MVLARLWMAGGSRGRQEMTYLGLVGLGEIVRHDGSVGVFLGGVVALVQDLVEGGRGRRATEGGREGGRKGERRSRAALRKSTMTGQLYQYPAE